MTNPHSQELIEACENLLGLVFCIKHEEQRKKEDLPPIVPQRFLGIAADQAITKLDKALREFKEAEATEGAARANG